MSRARHESAAMKLAEARRHALSLPEATEAPHFHFTSFRVRGKIFATAPPDGEYLHVFCMSSWPTTRATWRAF